MDLASGQGVIGIAPYTNDACPHTLGALCPKGRHFSEQMASRRTQAHGTAQAYRGWPHQGPNVERDDGGLDKLGIPRCLAATASGSHALGVGGPPASSTGAVPRIEVCVPIGGIALAVRGARRLAFGVGSVRGKTPSLGRSRPSLPRCAGELTNACERSMRPYRSNGFWARPKTSGGSTLG
jgi:hypothetical protein